MPDSLDLDAYLQRIAWTGPIAHDLTTLSGLLGAHMAAIPFENLDVLLGRPIRLDLEHVQAKLVHARRGGYCFEHGTLFSAALEALGFRPKSHLARVTMLVPREQAPLTHRFLTVPLDEGTFVLDPGFGGLASRKPLPLLEGAATAVDGANYTLVTDGAYRICRVSHGTRVVDAWASTFEEGFPVDFELGNHYTSTHPDSAFVNRIMMRASPASGRVTVMNRDVTFWGEQPPRVERLVDRTALRQLLVSSFGIELPEVEHMLVPTIPEWA